MSVWFFCVGNVVDWIGKLNCMLGKDVISVFFVILEFGYFGRD